jgi:hypothetical protein
MMLPVERWSAVSEKALRFAWSLSRDVHIIHVECEGEDSLAERYDALVAIPAKEAGLPVPELVLIKSPYRFVVRPIVDYALKLEKENPGRHVAVLLPELVETRWYYVLLHNNRATVLRTLLLFSGSERITVVNIPWYLAKKAA